MARKRQQWAFRLQQELKVSSSSHFVTLTYDEENLTKSKDGIPIVSKRDIQLFIKRLRKALPSYKLRYFLVSEYGPTTFRPHYHCIFFNLPLDSDLYEILTSTWKNGHIDIGSVTGASISYVCKYCVSATKLPSQLASTFMLCSKRPAIGSNYLTNAIKKWHHQNLADYANNQGFKIPLHRYYRDKIFTKVQKEKIKLHMDELRKSKQLEYDKKYKSYDDSMIPTGSPSILSQQIASFIDKQSKIIDKSNKI